MRAAAFRAVPHLLLIAVALTLAFMAREWAYATTYRLSLHDRLDASRPSAATERFDLEAGHVVPKIVTRDDTLTFRPALHRDGTLRVAAVADRPAAYEIRIRRNAGTDVRDGALAAGTTTLAVPVPADSLDLALISRGDVTWADPRLDRSMAVKAPAVLLLVLIAAAAIWRRSGTPARRALTPRARAAWLAAATLLVSAGGTTLLLEATLRAVGTRVSGGIREARHDLGELVNDPRWQDSPRYGRRLSPGIDVMNEWRHGDIIRMGFLSPAVSEGTLHRYPFRTDAEGFRNIRTRDPIAIAAIGDSFTDAQTMAIEAAWPAQLERRLGVPVQNYGTASYGPQQELLVLREFALRHRPRVVVLAFFAGNDIFEAEAFASAGRIDGSVVRSPTLGWPIKTVVRRADTWYVVNAWQAARRTSRTPAAVLDRTVLASAPAPAPPTAPTFDRGMFTVPVNGRVLRWALMPPYLNTLNFSAAEIAARRGWKITAEVLTEMQAASREAGAAFVVLFLPTKSQVSLPLLQRTFPRGELEAALRFTLRSLGGHADLDRLASNRRALNDLLRQFCEQAGLPLLDATDVLQRQFEAGENMYFPDDSHLNEAGEAVIAEAVASFLRSRGLQ
jgi:lysophospholipase L1-like esterase